MTRSSDPSPRTSDAEMDSDSPLEGQVEPSSQSTLIAAILGLFIVASLIVVILSWPGLRIALHTRAAEEALEKRNWEEAVPHLQTITERFPDAWLRQRQLGDCLLELGQAREALSAYKASLEHGPKQDLRARVGFALYRMEPENPEAPVLIEKARLAAPSDPRTNFYIAILREEQERYREAAYYFLGATADPYWFERSRPHIEEIRKRLLETPG